MTDHRRLVQRRGIARQIIHRRLDESAVAMRPRLARKPRQLHQMHPVRRRQPLSQRSPHLARRGETGDQDDIRPLPHHLDRQPVRGEGWRLGPRRFGMGGGEDVSSGEGDNRSQQEGAQGRTPVQTVMQHGDILVRLS
ncbi:hypothetical protein D3C86_1741620 [compost metagenome]